MKKFIILFILFVLFNTVTFSQKLLNCESIPLPQEKTEELLYSHSTQRNTQDNTQYVFNLYFHIIRNDNGNQVFNYSNGNSYPNITEENILDAVALLNRTYNQFDIFFKYKGFGFINNTNLLTTENSEFPNDFLNLNEIRSDSFNLFITNRVLNSLGNPLAGRASFNNTISVYNKEYLLTATLPHEIAHNFLIYHTRQNSESTSNCEYIDGSNCLTKGDEVCDTPASHPLREYVTHNGTEYVYNNFDNRTDCNGTIFNNVGFTNFMDTNLFTLNNYYNNLRTQFSSGQGIRMRETIENDTQNRFYQTMTSLESLYKPYSGGYIGGANPNHPNFPGIPSAPKFQKGFDYQFVSCYKSIFIFNTYNVSETPIGHPYFQSIKILQVSNEDTYNCNWPRQSAYQGGSVIQFGNSIDGNYIIKELDENKIKDPNLINTLPNGYNVIKTNFKNGQTIQKKIYKNN